MWKAALVTGCALAVLIAGCEEGCCVDRVAVDLPPNTLVQGQAYTFRMCIDATCTSGVLSPIGKGAICTSDLWLCDVAIGAPSRVTALFPDHTFLSGAPTRQVTFELTISTGTVARKSGTVFIETVGSGCASCRTGALTIR